jgi:2'-5' RNA ligase
MIETLRTFIAVPLSKVVMQELDKLQRQLMRACPARAVRWVPAENVHLTMHFLGDILPERVGPIKEALTIVARDVPPFSFTAGQLGAFPNTNRPRVIWVGVSDTASWLALLHEAVNESMEQLGYKREARRFSPHLTLGRIQRRAAQEDVRNVGKTLTATQVGTLGIVMVETLVFFQSVLRPGGAEYTPLATFKLGNAKT